MRKELWVDKDDWAVFNEWGQFVPAVMADDETGEYETEHKFHNEPPFRVKHKGNIRFVRVRNQEALAS